MASARPHHHAGTDYPLTPDDLYASPPPWDIGRPQPSFLKLAEAGALRGRVLDVGCGTGEHTLMAAGLGLEATGIDLASNALATAETKARTRGTAARFLRHDATGLTGLGQRYDTVLDCGLFHIFSDQERAAYLDGLRAVLPGGGRYFMLGLSVQEPGQWRGRMRKLTREEIEDTFTGDWRTDSIEPSTIDLTTDPAGIRAWLVATTRL
jgi:ubiquinone/menaquinone biosynthesis C-methylase UbiE